MSSVSHYHELAIMLFNFQVLGFEQTDEWLGPIPWTCNNAVHFPGSYTQVEWLVTCSISTNLEWYCSFFRYWWVYCSFIMNLQWCCSFCRSWYAWRPMSNLFHFHELAFMLFTFQATLFACCWTNSIEWWKEVSKLNEFYFQNVFFIKR